MKCSCPWCSKEATVPDGSPVGFQPTCEEHSWEGMLKSFDEALDKHKAKQPDPEKRI